MKPPYFEATFTFDDQLALRHLRLDELQSMVADELQSRGMFSPNAGTYVSIFFVPRKGQRYRILNQFAHSGAITPASYIAFRDLPEMVHDFTQMVPYDMLPSWSGRIVWFNVNLYRDDNGERVLFFIPSERPVMLAPSIVGIKSTKGMSGLAMLTAALRALAGDVDESAVHRVWGRKF